MNGKELLLEIYDLIKDTCLSIEQWGSTVLPYIDNPNDIDITYTFNTKEEASSARKLFHKKYDIMSIRKKYNFCIHFISLDYNEVKSLGAYQTYFAKPLFDFKLTDRHKNIFDNKEEYLETLKNFVNKYKDYRDKYILKTWYHVYTGSSMLKNNSYELTEEQIKNINILRTKDIESKKNIIDELIIELEGE